MTRTVSTPPTDAPATSGDARSALGWMHTARFLTTAAQLHQLPAVDVPEIAFVGRSNAGKSTCINTLTQQKRLAFASKTPGRTQSINLFTLGKQGVTDAVLADLPGYGYAKAGKQQVADWTRLVSLYLVGRPTLRRALLLIDARHGPKDLDRAVMASLDKAAVSYQVVLTKVDQLRPAERAERMASTTAELSRHPAAHPDIMATSAFSGEGIAMLRAAVAALAEWRRSREDAAT